MGLEESRRRVLCWAYLVGVVVGGVVLVGGGARAAVAAGTVPALLIASAYAVVVLFGVTSVGPERVRAWLLVVGLHLLGTMSLLLDPAESAWRAWLASAPVTAALLVGLRPALVSYGLVVVTLMGVAAAAGGSWLGQTVVAELDALVGTLVMTLAVALLVRGFGRAEERTKETISLLRATLESSTDGIIAFDRRGRITVHNGRFMEIWGLDPEAAEQTPHDELARAAAERLEDPELFLERLREMIEQPTETVHDEVRLKDGRVYERVAYPQWLDGESVGRVVTLRDETRRHRLEEDLRQKHKLEAVGQLAGGVAHDFNNMLQVIQGNARLLLEQPLEQEDRAMVAEISNSAAHSAALTRQLLSFSRKTPADPVVLDLGRAVERTEAWLRRTLPANIDLRLRVATVPPVRLDPAHLEQIIMNLALNARDAMPEGGTLSIGLWPGTGGLGAVLEVRDDGMGMPPSVLDRALEPFFTTKPMDEGTGLGLSSVYGMVRQAGGRLTLESEEGRGTVVRLLLPAGEQALSEDLDAPGVAESRVAGSAGVGPAAHGIAAATPRSPGRAAPAAVGRPEGTRCPDPIRRSEGRGEPVPAPSPVDPERGHVLVVEDEPAVLRLVVRSLENAGHVVLSAQRPSEALELLRIEEPRVDLLLTDLGLPEMGGEELARAVRGTRPGVRLLFMSGRASTDAAAVADGEAGMVCKPFRTEELLASVQRALA